MELSQSLKDFIFPSQEEISLIVFFVNLILCGILSFILSKVYQKYGDALSNREIFSRNFLILSLTTALVIMVVKSSLALSLGLVGALSIVRFRGAIKEPEELIYLFLAIAIGLGFGANQGTLTVIAFSTIMISIVIFRKIRDNNFINVHNLNLSSTEPHNINLEDIIKILKKNCSVINLKRLDETSNVLEISFLVEFENFEKFNESKKELKSLNKSINIQIIDNLGVY